MKLNKILLGITLSLFCLSATAQNYNTGIGLRAGDASGLTVKHFIGANTAIDGIITTDKDLSAFRVTGLYEIHTSAFNTNQLFWFYGGGGHFGSSGKSDVNIGIDGVVGLEWVVPEIPFSFSMDVKPSLDIIDEIDLDFLQAGLSIRYVF